jgi:hypothetical protein
MEFTKRHGRSGVECLARAQLALLIFSTTAFSSTLTVDLTDINNFDATISSGVWNPSSGQIQGALAPGGDAQRVINFGTGADGVFSDGPSQTGITVSGTTITLNTDTKSTYNFKTFTLSAGYTLNVTGSQVVRLRVLGNVTIAGTISLDASVGTDQPASNATHPPGGAGTGSGSAGGSGGITVGSPSSTGTTISATQIAGGGGGTDSTLSTTEGGGGGGCFGQGPDGANNATRGLAGGVANGSPAISCSVNRSTLAANFDDPSTPLFSGGAGGGGGGSYNNTLAGAGGGGGGGAIQINSSGVVQISGTITANGGNGGALTQGNGTDCGGAGGGGAGGAIWIQTANALAGSGTLDLAGGTGGASGSCTGLYTGGKGSRGVLRSDTSNGSLGTLALAPGGFAGDANNVVDVPANVTYSVYSQPIDMGQYYIDISAANETQGCGAGGTLVVTYYGSNDQSTWSSGVLAANISQLSAYRYIRFRVDINAPAAARCLTGLNFTYSLSTLSSMTLSGGLFCGSLDFQKGRKYFQDSGNFNGALSIAGDLGLLVLTVLAAWLWIRPRRGAFDDVLCKTTPSCST